MGTSTLKYKLRKSGEEGAGKAHDHSEGKIKRGGVRERTSLSNSRRGGRMVLTLFKKGRRRGSVQMDKNQENL